MAGNLTSWKKGQSGNPGGRPKKKLIDRALEELLLENDSEKARELAQRVLQLALAGDVLAIKFIAERTEGRAMQKVEISGELNAGELRQMSDTELYEQMAQVMAAAGYEVTKK